MKFYIILFGMFLHFHLLSSSSLGITSLVNENVGDKFSVILSSTQNNSKPVHYDLHLAIDMEKKTFEGKVDITITTTRITRKIAFDTTSKFDVVRILDKVKADAQGTYYKYSSLETKYNNFVLNHPNLVEIKEVEYINGKAVIHLKKNLQINKEYVITIFYKSTNSEAFVWLKEKNVRNKNMLYRTAVLQVFHKGASQLFPVYLGSRSERATFKLTLETGTKYFGVTGTDLETTTNTSNKLVRNFKKTSEILPSLLKIMISSLISSRPIEYEYLNSFLVVRFQVKSQIEGDLLRYDQYGQYIDEMLQHFGKYMNFKISLKKRINLDILVTGTSSNGIKDNPKFWKSTGVLILSRNSDVDTKFKRICEAITFQLFSEKLETIRELWLAESLSRYLVQGILIQAGKTDEESEDRFENITTLIEESKREDMMRESGFEIYKSPEITYRTGLTLINSLANNHESFKDCLKKFLEIKVLSVNSFIDVYHEDLERTTKYQLWRENYVHALWDMFQRIDEITVPLLSLKLNGKNVHIDRVDSESEFKIRSENGPQVMPVLVGVNYLTSKEESEQNRYYDSVYQVINTTTMDLNCLLDYEFESIDRAIVPFKMIHDKPSWKQFQELIKLPATINPTRAYLISDITDIILENINGFNEVGNLQMTEAFQMLKNSSTVFDYLTWKSLMKTVKRILPYVKGTELEEPFVNHLLQPKLDELYSLLIDNFVPGVKGHTLVTKLFVKLATMLGIQPHINSATYILQQWRNKRVRDIFSLIHKDIFGDVAGTIIGLMTTQTEIEAMAVEFHDRYSMYDDVTVLEPLKFINQPSINGSLFNLISKLLAEVNVNIESGSVDRSWISEVSDQINILFEYMVTGSPITYDSGLQFLHSSIVSEVYNKIPDLFWKLLQTLFTHVRAEAEYNWILDIIKSLKEQGKIKEIPSQVWCPMREAEDRFEWKKHPLVFKNALQKIENNL